MSEIKMNPEMVLFKLWDGIKIKPIDEKKGTYNIIRNGKTIGSRSIEHDILANEDMYYIVMKIDDYVMKCTRAIGSNSAIFKFSYKSKDKNAKENVKTDSSNFLITIGDTFAVTFNNGTSKKNLAFNKSLLSFWQQENKPNEMIDITQRYASANSGFIGTPRFYSSVTKKSNLLAQPSRTVIVSTNGEKNKSKKVVSSQISRTSKSNIETDYYDEPVESCIANHCKEDLQYFYNFIKNINEGMPSLAHDLHIKLLKHLFEEDPDSIDLGPYSDYVRELISQKDDIKGNDERKESIINTWVTPVQKTDRISVSPSIMYVPSDDGDNFDRMLSAVLRDLEEASKKEPIKEETVQEAEAEEEPKEEALVQETPIQEAVTEEEPKEEALVQEIPVQEAVTEDEPKEEAVAQEIATEEESKEETVQEAEAKEEPKAILENNIPAKNTETPKKPGKKSALEKTLVSSLGNQVQLTNTNCFNVNLPDENGMSTLTIDLNDKPNVELKRDGIVQLALNVSKNHISYSFVDEMGDYYNETKIDYVQGKEPAYLYEIRTFAKDKEVDGDKEILRAILVEQNSPGSIQITTSNNLGDIYGKQEYPIRLASETIDMPFDQYVMNCARIENNPYEQLQSKIKELIPFGDQVIDYFLSYRTLERNNVFSLIKKRNLEKREK